MRVFVAGASSEVERAERWSAKLRACGIIVVSTWPETVRQHGENPRGATKTARARWSADNLIAVATATHFWGLVPPEPLHSIDMWYESGFAERAGIPQVYSGDTRRSNYMALADEVGTDEAAFDWLLSIAGVTDRTAPGGIRGD